MNESVSDRLRQTVSQLNTQAPVEQGSQVEGAPFLRLQWLLICTLKINFQCKTLVIGSYVDNNDVRCTYSRRVHL